MPMTFDAVLRVPGRAIRPGALARALSLGLGPATASVALVAVALAAGCAVGPPPATAQMSPGAMIEVVHPLTVPAGRWSVYFQDGEVRDFGGIEDALPYCELKVYGPKPEPQAIAPDRLRVIAVERRIDRTAAAGPRLAALGRPGAATLQLAQGFDRVYWDYVTEAKVESMTGANPPGLLRSFTCTAEQEARLGGYLPLRYARRTVGEHLRLTPASLVAVEQ